MMHIMVNFVMYFPPSTAANTCPDTANQHTKTETD